jgi:taurine dioxygenase
MITVEPTGKILGARVPGVDLSQPLSDEDFRAILVALGTHGVLCFPNQTLTPRQQRDFSERLGKIQYSVSGKFNDPEVPEVGTLSNIMENGKPIGLADAGQDWHTDMSYTQTKGYANALYALKVPRRDGKVLGGTLFGNMYAAYDGLDPALKQRLQGMTATHDFNKFWDAMLAKGSARGALTDAQKALRPPATHPLFMVHPVTGRTSLYCNPGYAIRIDGMEPAESERIINLLFEHQLKPEYLWTHEWSEGDFLLWDNLCTVHNAIADYTPEEHRLMKRCQIMADKVFDPAWQQRWVAPRQAA